MRLAFLLTALLFFLSGCARVEHPPRSDHQLFKGVELYSWRDGATETWHFALLPGTNRNKSLEEIMQGHNPIQGTKSLKQEMSALAVGEHIFWSQPYPQLSFPPDAVVSDLKAYAVDRHLELSIAGQP